MEAMQKISREAWSFLKLGSVYWVIIVLMKLVLGGVS